jgi:hypothetical protein
MITPRIDCTVDTQETRGKTVIRVLVPRGDDPPYAIEDNKIYVRDEAETSLAVRDEIVQLVRRGQVVTEPAAPVKKEAPPEQVSAPVLDVAAAALPAGAEPHAPPRTGVEIVATEERNGRQFHTMRDLRNGNMVKNVTRQSARKLWHYALSEHESGKFKPTAVAWHGDLGLWKKTHKGGVSRYDLVQRANGEYRIYYGVTEDGIHGEWKGVVGEEE